MLRGCLPFFSFSLVSMKFGTCPLVPQGANDRQENLHQCHWQSHIMTQSTSRILLGTRDSARKARKAHKCCDAPFPCSLDSRSLFRCGFFSCFTLRALCSSALRSLSCFPCFALRSLSGSLSGSGPLQSGSHLSLQLQQRGKNHFYVNERSCETTQSLRRSHTLGQKRFTRAQTLVDIARCNESTTGVDLRTKSKSMFRTRLANKVSMSENERAGRTVTDACKEKCSTHCILATKFRPMGRPPWLTRNTAQDVYLRNRILADSHRLSKSTSPTCTDFEERVRLRSWLKSWGRDGNTTSRFDHAWKGSHGCNTFRTHVEHQSHRNNIQAISCNNHRMRVSQMCQRKSKGAFVCRI